MPIRPTLQGVEFEHISDDMSRWLERPFLEEEVIFTLNSMEEYKAPDSDGFPTKIFKIFWEVVAKDIMTVFADFHSKDSWCRSLSATFITLILKKNGAVELKDFRPISLVGSMYKLLSKTLVICFKSSLVDIISNSQQAFLPSRHMTDCSLLANEYLDAMSKARWPGVVCKGDMEKAYDHVTGAMSIGCYHMGFGLKWRNWIKICISSPSFYALVNGVPKGFFRGGRGLRQGDPLSLYLFIIVTDLLGKMMTKANAVGLVQVFCPIDGGPSIPFIQYADETLFMLKAEVDYVENLRYILLIMEAATGLKMN